MSDDKSEADWRNDIRDQLLVIAETPKYEGGSPRVPDMQADEKRAFLERAFEIVANHLAENMAEYEGKDRLRAGLDHFEAVYDLLDPSNVEDIDVRQNGWHSPTVRIWLSNREPWANDAWREEFKFSVSREHYNGNPTHAVLDVRPR